MTDYIIYGLRCPKTDEYKYIGKSSSGLHRAKSHLTYSHNDSVNHWVAELREEGLCPLIDVLEECLEDDLQIKEKFWIQFYINSGCKLMNEIVYRGSTIEKLQKEIAIEENKLKEKLEQLKHDVKQLDSIYKFIRFIRKQRGLTQKDLAEITGIALRTINSIELGTSNTSYQTMEKILDILGYKLIPILKTLKS